MERKCVLGKVKAVGSRSVSQSPGPDHVLTELGLGAGVGVGAELKPSQNLPWAVGMLQFSPRTRFKLIVWFKVWHGG